MNDDSGRYFLEAVDFYIRDHLQKLTCSEIYKLYFNFFSELKNFKGNANGFTGLSEFIIFRAIYHLLGGSFKIENAEGSADIYEFRSKTDKSIRIGQSTPIRIDNKKLYPDVVVYKNNDLIAAAQIKIYVTGGIKEVSAEIEKLKMLRAKFTNMHAFFIVFSLSEKGKIASDLKRYQDNETWFRFVILNENESNFAAVLEEGLNLKELIRSNQSK